MKAGWGWALAALLAIPSRASAQPDLRSAFGIARITPAALAAAGFVEGDVQAFVANLRGSAELAAVVDGWAEMSAKETQLAAAIELLDPVDPVGHQAIADAESQRALAQRELEAAVVTAIGRGCTGMPEAFCDRLNAWRKMPVSLPPEMRILEWNDSDLRLIHSALLAERLSVVSGLPISQELQARVASARAIPEVAAAAAHLANRLTPVAAALEAQLSQ
ncbi:MAG: hypothetical protein IT436_16145 [Phycisphaerales bacterium]|nr:hypothetical protein [Phycisphaerales bacterium]